MASEEGWFQRSPRSSLANEVQSAVVCQAAALVRIRSLAARTLKASAAALAVERHKDVLTHSSGPWEQKQVAPLVPHMASSCPTLARGHAPGRPVVSRALAEPVKQVLERRFPSEREADGQTSGDDKLLPFFFR